MKIHLPLSLAKVLLLVGMAQMTPMILAESVSSSLSASTAENETLSDYEIDLDLGLLLVPLGISANGSAIVGQNGNHAFVYKDGVMTDLGTLMADKSGNSIARAISTDGSVIVGESSYGAGFAFHAFVYKDGVMTDLGSLKADNSGWSYAYGVSGDGSVIVGGSNTDEGWDHVFVYKDGVMNDLGTLRADNSGNSAATRISTDGSVIVGWSAIDGSDDNHAFVHKDGVMTDLGTLKADNSGRSIAYDVSSDGSVIVGESHIDGSANRHAFVYKNGVMADLGTLKSDNSGDSYAHAVSANGAVIVGVSNTDKGWIHAFVYKDDVMTDLGSLKAENSGDSYANAVSADGAVIVGQSDTDDGSTHGVVWKLKDTEVIMVDTTNSNKAMSTTAYRGFQVLDLYQSAVNSLANSRCSLGANTYGFGVFSQYDSVRNNHRIATGLYGATKLSDQHWIVGGAVNFANNTDLIQNYSTRGTNTPGVGAFTRYQSKTDGSGWNVELSGAYLTQDLTIRRDQLANTEAGQGNSELTAYQFGLSTGYGINLCKHAYINPTIALVHHSVNRDRYTENRYAEFPASYAAMGDTRTTLQLGVDGQYRFNNIISVDANAGMDVKLAGRRDDFRGHIDYIGAYSYESGANKVLRFSAGAGINFQATQNIIVRVNAGWMQTDYDNNALQVGLGVCYSW